MTLFNASSSLPSIIAQHGYSTTASQRLHRACLPSAAERPLSDLTGSETGDKVSVGVTGPVFLFTFT
jgi:hypothetical protein